MTWSFAETGHLRFTPFTASTLRAQVFWGAVWLVFPGRSGRIPETMKIDVREEGLVTVLTLEGDFVIGGPENEFDRAVTQLLEGGHVNLLIDLGSVRRLDSSALDAMVRALSGSQEEGGVTKLVRVTPRISRLLEITKLGSVFETYDDQERAIASFLPPR